MVEAHGRSRITAAAEARNQDLPGDYVELEPRTAAGEIISTGFITIDDFEG